ncbi:MAG: TAXI family TRAP transporter solute-binding subunit [Actinobacteria bacterium]|nr:TAXI family TRAP transporter solute-binding subunit [Actinomycetota bacterium]
MKKALAVLLVLVLALSLAGLGCSKGDSPKEAKREDKPPAKPVDMVFATGGTGGTYYPFGGAIAKVWKDKIPGLNATIQATGGSVENVRLLGKKEVELAFSQNDTAYQGYNGLEAFKEKNEKITNFSALGSLYPEAIQIVVRADSNIKTIADLKGKKVAVGAAGSGTEASARQIFGIYGLDYRTRKDLEPFYLNFAESAQQFKDKHIDAVYLVTGVPAAPLQDITTSTEIRLLEVTDFDKVKAAYPFYAPLTINGGTYKGQMADAQTVTLLATILVRNDVDPDLVYKMTKVLFEEKDEIAKGHAKGKQLDLQKALQGIAIPIHPGSQKYYDEKGVKK